MQIAMLSKHGWSQHHFNKDGKRVANIGDSIREVVMVNILEQLNIKKQDITVIAQNEIKTYCGDDVRLLFDDMINDDSVIDELFANEKIHPVFISCFFYDDIFAGHLDRVKNFKKYEPIGCRDEHSRNLCIKNGIDAYLTGCFTLCVDKKTDSLGSKTYIVDPTEELLQIIPEEIKNKAKIISHAVELEKYPIDAVESERLYKIANDYLENYRNNAAYVISGRLHATLPCFAMGIPATIINRNFNYKFGWLDKWLKLNDFRSFETLSFDTTNDESKYEELELTKQLIKNNIKYAITFGCNDIDLLKKIDQIYEGRNKNEINSFFKYMINQGMNQYNNTKIKYAIWGAGLNGGYVYQIMQEMYPEAQLVAIVDKFKEGQKYGVPIIKANEIAKYDIQHIFVSSNPAIPDAISTCDLLYKDDKTHYTTVVTDQTC